ncbi:MAG TPA: hypothetical protein GX708_07800, partial [Gallicola sp.]|nr:hypothetical protein [Gallicola sp.]
ISYNDVDGCILKNKLFIFKSDGIYLYIYGNIYLLDYNISNITHVSYTEDYAYIYADTDKLYKFDGDILTEIGSYEISEILAVSTKDTKFSIAESGIDDNLQFGNNSQSMLLKKFHGDSYAINLCQNNNFYTSLFVKNLVVKSEIKNIIEKTLKEKVEDYANTIKTWTDIDLWLRADWGVVTDSNNKVSRWEDFVHPDYNIIQNEADRRPLLVDNYANTFPALKFDGVDDYLNGGDICDLKLSGGTLIAVLQHEYLTNVNHFAISKANNRNTDKSWYIRIISGAENYYIGFADVKGSEIIYSYYGYYQTPDYKLENVVTAFKIDNANNVIKKYQNGVNTHNVTFDGTYDMNNNYDLIIGALGRIGYIPYYFWEGHIMEIIKFDRVLSDDEFAYVHEYLNLKYNLY